MPRSRIVRLIATGLLSICMSSCGGRDVSTASPVPTPRRPTVIPLLPSAPNHTVNWEGATSDRLGVGFQISGERVTGIYIELPEIQGDVCVFGAGGFSLDGFDNFDLGWGRSGPPITDGAFTVVSIAPIAASSGTSQTSASVDFTLKGRINGSSGEGTGDFRFSTRTGSPPCTGTRQLTWNIARKGE